MVEVTLNQRVSRINDIIIAGVGGQGSITTMRILTSLFLAQGWQVKASEVHGMAQRGGSVETHVRRGRIVYSPLVSFGKADMILALEQLECLRYLPWMKKGGLCVTSDERIMPVTVTLGGEKYPEDAKEKVMRKAGILVWVEASRIAKEAGNAKASNVALLGASSPFLDASEEEWERAIRASVSDKTLSANMSAFWMARELTLKHLSSEGRAIE